VITSARPLDWEHCSRLVATIDARVRAGLGDHQAKLAQIVHSLAADDDLVAQALTFEHARP